MKRNLFDLSGRVAIVTGAARGLGRAIAEGYAEYGAAVALVDLDAEGLDAVAEGIRADGGQALTLPCDITKEAQVEATVARVVEAFDQVNIMANVAGISGRYPAEEMPYEVWDRVIEVNLRGTFLFSVVAGKQMIRQGKGGRIINMASAAGLVGLETGNINYSASKGGVIAMSRCLAVEWAKYNILVNTVAPTHFRTPFLDDLLAKKPETLNYFLSNIPLGRMGEPQEIVGPFIFLASEAASMVTGHCLVVDGGHTAK
jgi:NAD(P)-dependent dehydrogenase (short-subunit alcohol dehydrogenase family)